MAIEGPLKELSATDVFQLLDLSRKTGTLRVTSELRQNAGTVFFEEGAVVGASIKTNPHPLGRFLLRAGRVTEADLQRARALQSAGDQRLLGDILVGEGLLTTRDLARFVRQQIEEVVFELVGWSEGYFTFEEGKRGTWPTEAETRVATGFLLMEAARRTDEWSRIEKKVTHLGLVPRLAPVVDTATPLELLPAEWELLSSVDGSRTVRGLADVLGRSEFEVARTIFGLATAGIILLEDPTRQAVEAAGRVDLTVLLSEVEQLMESGSPEEACQVALQAVATHPDQPLAYLTNGKALLAAGHVAQAADALRHATHLDPHSATAQRLLGVALAGSGRFREAAQALDEWARLGDRPPEEAAQTPLVERVRYAAMTMDMVLRSMRD